jgi:hypothetical protein
MDGVTIGLLSAACSPRKGKAVDGVRSWPHRDGWQFVSYRPRAVRWLSRYLPFNWWNPDVRVAELPEPAARGILSGVRTR